VKNKNKLINKFWKFLFIFYFIGVIIIVSKNKKKKILLDKLKNRDIEKIKYEVSQEMGLQKDKGC